MLGSVSGWCWKSVLHRWQMGWLTRVTVQELIWIQNLLSWAPFLEQGWNEHHRNESLTFFHSNHKSFMLLWSFLTSFHQFFETDLCKQSFLIVADHYWSNIGTETSGWMGGAKLLQVESGNICMCWFCDVTKTDEQHWMDGWSKCTFWDWGL